MINVYDILALLIPLGWILIVYGVFTMDLICAIAGATMLGGIFCAFYNAKVG